MRLTHTQVRERDEARVKAANADASILALLAEQGQLKKVLASAGGAVEVRVENALFYCGCVLVL